MVQELEAREEGNLEIRETFSSLKEEVDTKTKKLNKVEGELQGEREGLLHCVWCVCVVAEVEAEGGQGGGG